MAKKKYVSPKTEVIHNWETDSLLQTASQHVQQPKVVDPIDVGVEDWDSIDYEFKSLF